MNEPDSLINTSECYNHNYLLTEFLQEFVKIVSFFITKQNSCLLIAGSVSNKILNFDVKVTVAVQKLS